MPENDELFFEWFNTFIIIILTTLIGLVVLFVYWYFFQATTRQDDSRSQGDKTERSHPKNDKKKKKKKKPKSQSTNEELQRETRMTEFNENDEQAVAADQQTNLPGNGLSLQHTSAADEAKSSVGSKPSWKSVTTMTAKQSSATSTATRKWTPAPRVYTI